MELESIITAKEMPLNGDDDDGGDGDDADDNSLSTERVTDKGPVRETWDGKFEFLLSIVGYTVGLGNMWRFPFLCYRNGGGAFLIPFALFLLLCGGPLYYLEVCIGQFSGKSTVNVWDMCPLMRGLGVAACISSSVFMWAYAIVFAWIIYFLYHSFFPSLGWMTCDNAWNTPSCLDYSAKASQFNVTLEVSINKTKYTSPGWEFWQYNVLNKSEGIDHAGSVQWHLLVGLFIGWMLVFLCLIKGIKSLGKVVYVTVVGPYILLTVLFIRGVTLDGAWGGLQLYLIPKFDRLASSQIWTEAAVQVFYSLGPAWGSLITMASFNKFHNNALRDAVVVCFFDIFTAFYGGLVVFSVIGFLSKQTGTPIDDMPFAGPALAFIVYPQALGQLPLPQFWSVLFFLTLVLIGIDTQFGTFEVVSNMIIDLNYKKLHKYRVYVSGSIVICFFLLGIPLTFSNGLYIFQLADWYMATFSILVVAILECFVMSWIYGANRFSRDIAMMLGKPPSVFLRIQWAIITPVFLCVILLLNFISYSPVTGEDGYQFPSYALAVGNVIAFGPLLAVFVVPIYHLYRTPGTFQTKIRLGLSPNTDWEPTDPEIADVYRTHPYKYSRGIVNRIVNDTFGIKKNTNL